ncbi:MAG TPA: glucosidase [Actinomycetota bacterium]|nr:glucosidase [Actinomycetota bacterium]
MEDPERARLAEDMPWRQWGPYLAERQWGTVREDYSASGEAWEYFPHDHARSRTYRWSEDGLGGICDLQQTLCFAFAFWNGVDPILKERIFGLTNSQGNHGEDAKEYWWFLDSTPTHSWMRWRYVYPQGEFPYSQLVDENARRGVADDEFDLLDSGLFDDDRYWDITADYAKATPDDLCIRLRVRNAGPLEATLHVLPTIWFRNRWWWKDGVPKPDIRLDDGTLVATHRAIGERRLAGSGAPEPLFCENETNNERLFGIDNASPYPKDGINDHVTMGSPTVNPAHRGTKAALHYELTVPAGQTVEIRLRFSGPDSDRDLGKEFGRIHDQRAREADEFYASLTAMATDEEAMVMRQAFAGLLWSKQFYFYDVRKWMDGDPTQPPPPPQRHGGRNAEWRHLNNFDVMSMPDTWEYPWYAAWDLAFHCISLAHVDPAFAKHQLMLLSREWFMHPNGQLPAYEWAFGDVNPPVHAWAALRVFEIDGSRDIEFLQRIFHKLTLNFTWWINRKDAEGNNVFEGGFLGLDNIGPLDRSQPLPGNVHLEQSDGTAWMAMFCLNMLEISLVLAAHQPAYEDMCTKFFEHFTYIATAMNDQGLWNEEDGFYYDVMHRHDSGEDIPMRVRSMVGLIPLCATTTLGPDTLARLPEFSSRLQWFLKNRNEFSRVVAVDDLGNDRHARLLSIVSPERLVQVLQEMLDPNEFLSPYGIRSVSRYHLEHPFQLDLDGVIASVGYDPGVSRSGVFGGNSNWRGPVWFPVNYLLIESLRRFHRYLREDFTVEYPTGSSRHCTLGEVADDLSQRLVNLFLRDRDGRRPTFGRMRKFQTDPAWNDAVLFFEYFHGDTGEGLGASHQTGWTALVADLILHLSNRDGVSAT